MTIRYHRLNIGLKKMDIKKNENFEYKKFNSFNEIKLKEISIKEENALKRIKELRENLINLQLDNYKKKIILRLIDDIFGKTEDRIQFKLTPNVISEIVRTTDQELPRYLFHRYRYEIFPQTKEIDNYPPYLQIEPSSICNYRCVFCFETDKTFTNKKNGFMGRMSLDLFKKIVDQAENNIDFISLASRGEPLSNPDVIEMLKYSNGKFLNLKINTNASLLDEKKIHAILSYGVGTVVFSADAADEKLYAKLRVNGNLNKVLKNVEKFNEIKSKQYPDSRIISRVSGVKVNEDQKINDMFDLWCNLVDQVAFVNYVPWENVYQSPENKISEPCSDLWRRFFIWWDGKVNPCDVDYKSSLSRDNINNLNISESLNGNNYSTLRLKHIDKERSQLSPCSSCSVT